MSASPGRPVLYCLLPSELAPQLHDLLRRYFRDDPFVEVVVERRDGERRAGHDRRADPTVADAQRLERRRVRDLAGRRAGERRATVVDVAGLELPRKARDHAEQIVFFERLEPSAQALEDIDTARLVARVQAGSNAEFATLYTRYFDRVYGYLRVALRDQDEAEDAAQQVFLKVFERVHSYRRQRQPFRAWLFVIVRNQPLDVLRLRARVDVREPDELARVRDSWSICPTRSSPRSSSARRNTCAASSRAGCDFSGPGFWPWVANRAAAGGRSRAVV
jgi:RNA polymerase sigma-70 factor (ECF subfamily)